MLLGVTNKAPHEPVGTKAFPRLEIPEAEATLANDLSPVIRIKISEHMLDEGRVVAIEIPSRAKGQVIRYNEFPYMKTGNQTRKMTDQELARILTETTPHWLDETCLSDQSGEEVMGLLDVKSFYEMIGKPMPQNRSSVMERLSSEGIVSPAHASEKFSISRMGVLLLANSIKKCSSEMAVKRFEIIGYKPNAKAEEIVFNYCCDRGYAVGFEDMVNAAMEQLAAQAEYADGEAMEMAPRLAVRELLANAIIHQDFENKDRVVLKIFGDIAVLINPGVSLVKVDFMMQDSESRNAGMLNLMRKFKLAEHATSGIVKIIASVEQSKSAPPKFRFTDSSTHVEISRLAEYGKMSWSEMKIAAYQHCLLQNARKAMMTNASLRERFNLDDEAGIEITQLLKELVKEKKIKRSEERPGSRRHVGYVPHWA